MKKYFITGIDTDIGKTFVSIGLCQSFKEKNINVGYFKPLQSGAYLENGILKAPDIEELKKYLSIPHGFSYLLKGEVSPYLASKINSIKIDTEKIKKDIEEFSSPLDVAIIEGAGGLYCPFCENKTFADFISEINIPAIIVATPDLGRLNHILMTLECAKFKKINVKGLIINKMPKNPTVSEKYFLEELKDFTDAEILCTIPKNCTGEELISVFSKINL
ncbi:MAG: dethiobiotin synthase [Candidatus Gastranaerophilales bacterium]|nr:dethiobiotin synthase [Candidatus Gastranaerophilales bacterium]